MKLDQESMIFNQLKSRGINNLPVLEAMEKVPRHLFVTASQRKHAYEDHPLPIGYNQTISQPYIVAFMLEMLDMKKSDMVLEIGTGSGYQTAILSLLVKKVISLEIIPELAASAAKRLRKMGYRNVEVYKSSGKLGWPELAPYQRIIGAAAAKKIPAALIEQLDKNGRMIFPVGRLAFSQHLQLYVRDKDGKLSIQKSLPVRFVPLI
ncbi:MAG: protein-L-isoaspartate(D-aspartate) O-methyltransferase [Candidatus Neomarinimicrobiota bacterium]